MRKATYILLFAVIAALPSCKESSDSALGPLTNLNAEAEVLSVVLTWTNPTMGDYYYSVVEYTGSDGETVRLKVSKYSENPDLGSGYTKYKIGGLDDSTTYEFHVTPCTVDGTLGETLSVSCRPEGVENVYKYLASSVTAEPMVEGALLTWENEYNVPVTLSVSFKDVTGNSRTLSLCSSTSDTLELYAFADPTELSVVSSNDAGEQSEVYTLSVTPQRGEIPHDRMSIYDYSSWWGNNPAYSPENVLDDDIETYWHTDLVGQPHYFVIDLGTAHKVNWVELIRRTDVEGDGTPKEFKVEYATEEYDPKTEGWETVFTEIGTFDFEQSYIYNHAVNFDPVVARFIKVELINNTNPTYTYIAEFLAYYADTADHYAEEASSELSPDPDDDATYYETIEYMTPDLSITASNLDIEASNPDNPSEYTYTTTGGDSWCVLNPLKSDAAGTVLVFQYKSTAELRCEFFWCAGGYGVGGPTGGIETDFNILETDEWKTFKQNMATPMSDYGWGKAGDVVRFDIGDGAGVTVVVRNMHWREAQDGE